MSIPDDVISPQSRGPEKSSSTCLILGLVFGGIGGFVVLCGGCCIGSLFFVFSQVEQQAREPLASNAVIQEHIGEIRTLDVDWTESMQKMSQNEENVFVFRITGDKGSGTVTAKLLDDGTGSLDLYAGQLRLDTGDTYELVEDVDFDALGPSNPEDMMEVGSEEFARQVQDALAGNAILEEQVGEITAFTYDLDLSMDEPGENVYVFHVSGSKANGRLRAECITVDARTESVKSAELVLESGEHVQLFPDKPLP